MADRIRRSRGERPSRPSGPEADALERPRLSGPEIAAAALAGLAEAGLVFLPLRLVLASVVSSGSGPLVTYPMFALIYAGGVALTADLRRVPGLPVAVAGACGAVGLAQAQVWGSGTDAVSVVLTVVLALAVGVRMVFLAARDWRDPIGLTFGVGAVLVLAEALMIGSDERWRGVSAAVVAVFFVGALASRAMSVLASGDMSRREGDRRLANRASLAMVGLAAAALAAAGLLAGRNGPLSAIGSTVLRLGGLVVALIVLAMAQLMRPVFWAASHVFVHTDAARRFLENLRKGQQRVLSHGGHPGGSGAGQRLLGLLVLALLAWLLFRLIRRRLAARGPAGVAETGEEPEITQLAVPADEPEPRRRLRFRRRPRELPEQTVRRWYAEALLLLESRGLARDRSATPGEFGRRVAEAIPEAAAGFAALTRSYEDARYGLLDLDRAGLTELSKVVDRVVGVLRRWTPPPSNPGLPGEESPDA